MMSTAGQPGSGGRRQEPISCSLCRRRKLRCDRRNPCSNCVSRKVTCEREGLLVPAASRAQNDNASTAGPAAISLRDGEKHEIISRLERLERLALQGKDGHFEYSSAGGTFNNQQPTPQSATSPYEAEDANEAAHKVDTKRLEDVGTKENLLLAGLSDGIRFEVLSIQQIVASDPSSFTAFGDSRARLIMLPSLSEALSLLDIYAEYVDYLHHIVLLTKLRSQIYHLYDCLSRTAQLQPPTNSKLAPAALITSIFASAAASIAEIRTRSNDKLLTVSPGLSLMSVAEARACSILWMKATFDHLDYSRHIGSGCIEDVQAIITVFFLIYNLEGFSARARTGFGQGIAIARDLGLHRIDHPTEKKDRDSMETETARRVWWYICGTDWLLSLSGGPQEGVYNILPHHMRVEFPRNINDSILTDPHTPANYQEPLSTPTSNSYLIQRLKLATICRKIVDAMPMSPSTPEMIPYEQFTALDKEFEKFFAELPPFFQMKRTSYAAKKARTSKSKKRPKKTSQHILSGTPYIDRLQSGGGGEPEHIATQRYMINMTANTRRCKFHQPFLIRGFTDPKYRYSRDACLQSARAVLAIQQDLENEGYLAMGMFGLSGMNHHLFFATIALVMDLCFNKEDGPDKEMKEKLKKEEVWRACRILDAAKEKSLVAKRFLESLVDVLRKHGIRLVNEAGRESDMTELSGSGPPVVQGRGLETTDFDPPNDLAAPQLSEFDAIWQTYIDYAPTDFSLEGWEDPFVGLDGL